MSTYVGPSPIDIFQARLRLVAACLRRTAPSEVIDEYLREADLAEQLRGEGRVAEATRVEEVLQGFRERMCSEYGMPLPWGLEWSEKALMVAEAEIRRLGGAVPWRDEKENKEEDKSGEDHRKHWERFLSGPVGHPI